MSTMRWLVLILLCLVPQSVQSKEFELKKGDRVVWLGGTLVEREQRYGYWECLLTSRYPNHNITFRNLGWSGDNVHGEARLRFDIHQPELGLQRMVELTLAEKPTVIFIAYGTNESFEGKAGLPKFEQGLEKLLKALGPAKARIVLFSPLPETGKILTVEAAKNRNRDIALYRDAIKKIAAKHQLDFGDLFGLLGEGKQPFPEDYSDNGIHLTASGYAQTTETLRQALGLPAMNWEVTVGAGLTAARAEVKATEGKKSFTVTGDFLPVPQLLSAAPRIIDETAGSKLQSLLIDGQPISLPQMAKWSEGVRLLTGPDQEQSKQLLQKIVEKNQLYFYRWRPQNETYLTGFRKHEQGRNAKEVVEFDPLIAAKEKEIAQLAKPTTHRYAIVEVQSKP